MLFGVPLWSWFTYAGFSLAICIGMHAMTTRLDRRHHWLVMFGLPMCMWGGHLVITLPASAAAFSTTEPLWLWFGATVTLVMSIGLAWAMSMVYCIDGKLAQSGKASPALNVRAA